MEAFERGQPSRYLFSYATPQAGSEQPRAEFTAYQVGAYIQDEWQATDDLRLTIGLRADVPILPETPTFNQTAFEAFGVSTNSVATGNPLWSPRLGFNYQNELVNNELETQVRGGLGLFAGDPPIVWISNQFSNSGADFFRIDQSFGYDDYYGEGGDPDGNGIPGVQFIPQRNEGQNIRELLPRAGDNDLLQPEETTEINVMSDDFKYPQIFRANLAVDQQLPNGFSVTLEGLYSNTINDVTFTNLNLEQSGTSLYGRPIYDETVSNRFTNALLMRNTNKGYGYSGTIQLQRQVREGLSGSLSYTINESRSVNTGSSSRAISNWQFNENVDVNNPVWAAPTRRCVIASSVRWITAWSTWIAFPPRSASSTTVGRDSPLAGSTQATRTAIRRASTTSSTCRKARRHRRLESENWESMDAFIDAWADWMTTAAGLRSETSTSARGATRSTLQITQNIMTYQPAAAGNHGHDGERAQLAQRRLGTPAVHSVPEQRPPGTSVGMSGRQTSERNRADACSRRMTLASPS